MKKFINIIFSFFKYVLLIVAFGITLFIILKLYTRLNKNLTDSINIFLPYFILLVLFVISICLSRDYVRNNIFFNITCCLVFSTNIIVCLRAIFDTNMLFNTIQKMGVNFNYFNDYLSFNKIMLYGLCIVNFLFLFIPNNEEEPIKEKIKIENVGNDSQNNKEDEVIIKKIELDDEII